MLGILPLRNKVQPYAWGSRTAIAELLGRPVPSSEPEAELWIGAHAQAPSEVLLGERWRPLPEVVREMSTELLGPDADPQGVFPFLLKVLAAEQPLSIQAHPDAIQAAAGFAHDEAAGIPRDAAERRYRDTRAKPELIFALTPFRAMHGFRAPAEAHQLFGALGLADLFPEIGLLATSTEASAEHLERFLAAFLRLPDQRLAAILEHALAACRQRSAESVAYAAVVDLADAFPNDRGVLSPLFLHLIELAPGEALHTGAGIFHAYLDGVGIELMESSDNVLRGGLTHKLVDADELLRVLRFEPREPRAMAPRHLGEGALGFLTPEGLELVVLDLDRSRPAELRPDGVEILLVTEGEGKVSDGAASRPFKRGDAFLVPACVEAFGLEGNGRVFRAARRMVRSAAPR